MWVHNSDEAHVITYLRRSPEETDLIAVNMADVPFTGSLEVPPTAWQEVDLLPRGRRPHQPGVVALPALSLAPFGVRLFRQLNAH